MTASLDTEKEDDEDEEEEGQEERTCVDDGTWVDMFELIVMASLRWRVWRGRGGRRKRGMRVPDKTSSIVAHRRKIPPLLMPGKSIDTPTMA